MGRREAALFIWRRADHVATGQPAMEVKGL
jgi:hypothetical protein